MKILALDIERQVAQHEFCGTVDYQLHDLRIGTLLWVLEASAHNIRVSFVQGNADDWDVIARKHSRQLSDRLILAVARERGWPALAAPHTGVSAVLETAN